METKTTMMVMGKGETGKTIAATNVFSAMTLGGGIQNKDETVRFDLVANDAWDVEAFAKNYMAMMDGEPLPNGNVENISYELIFRINGEDVASILYMDYRGGILHTKDTLANELKDFDYMLSHSSLLVHIVPGDVLNDYIMLNGKRRRDLPLMTPEERGRFSRVSEANNYINVVMHRLKNITGEDRKVPVLFYVTKADLVTGGKDALIPGLERLIREYGLGAGRPVLGCYSTLGWDVEIVETVREGNSVRIIQSGMDPYGFEIPMMLTVGYRLSQAGKAWAADEEKRLDESIQACRDRELRALSKVDSIGNESDTVWQVLNFWSRKKRGAERQAAQQQQRNIAAQAQQEEQRAKAEKESLEQRNTDRRSSMQILEYLKEEYGEEGVLYLDQHGQKKPLDDFFK